ncbi:MAG: TSUP family transporter [Alphaproteobacteria bacterium]|nr:TSUP family transporter [Alphaproteobacteria bacterium]
MMDLFTLSALFGVALVAGFVDSIAGGGGLLCLPSLLIAGLDPVAALATNKLQGTFGTASATHTFWKKGALHPKAHVVTVATTFVGAALGVAAVAYAPKHLLTTLLPPLLILIALYFALSPKLSDAASHPRLPAGVFTFGFGPLIGFYDGIFGPGTGSFFMLALVTLFGLGVVEATGRTKLFNFTSNIAALLMFALGGHIVWLTGLVMGAGQVIGAQVGAHTAIRNGAKIIRPLLVTVCVIMAIKLLMDPANPLRQLL